MTDQSFVDHYEALQLSPSADADTVARVYRLLAKRFHPDNSTSGDAEMFDVVTKAYEVLSNTERRAKYDVAYDKGKGHQWRIFDQHSASDGREEDRRIFHGVLSVLYIARRRDPENGGLGAVHLERMLGVPCEHLDFPLWCLRRRSWIETLPSGQIGITISGVDVLGSEELSLPSNRLLTDTAVDPTTAPSPRMLAEGEATGTDAQRVNGSDRRRFRGSRPGGLN